MENHGLDLAPAFAHLYHDVKHRHGDQGSEAIVFEAVRRSSREEGDRVAIKVLRPEPGLSAEDDVKRTRRFRTEFEILNHLRHDHVAGAYDWLADTKLDGASTAAFSLEWLPDNLKKRIGKFPDGLPAADLEAWLGEALEGVGALHKVRIAARDIRPENLLLGRPPQLGREAEIPPDAESIPLAAAEATSRDILKVADLGMARTPESTGTYYTSNEYKAPEVLTSPDGAGGAVFLEHPGMHPEPEAFFPGDLYSLGMIFYRAAVGPTAWGSLPELKGVYGDGMADRNERWKLWHGDTARILTSLGQRRKDLPTRVVRVIDGLVQKDRARRYRSAVEALQDLRQDPRLGTSMAVPSSGSPAAPVPPTMPLQLKTPEVKSRRQRPKWPVPVLAIAVTVALAIWLLGFGKKETRPVRTQESTTVPAADTTMTANRIDTLYRQVTVSADEPCRFKLDDTSMAPLQPGSPRELKLRRGEKHKIDAITGDGRTWSRVLPGDSLQPDRLTIRFVARNKSGTSQAPIVPRQGIGSAGIVPSRRRADPMAPPGETLDERAVRLHEAGIIDYGNVMWTAAVLGDGVTWFDAVKLYRNCRIGGYGDWRLPTTSELLATYDQNSSSCLRFAHGFRTGNAWSIWTSEREGTTRAKLVCFNSCSTPYAAAIRVNDLDASAQYGVLCVRDVRR